MLHVCLCVLLIFRQKYGNGCAFPDSRVLSRLSRPDFLPVAREGPAAWPVSPPARPGPGCRQQAPSLPPTGKRPGAPARSRHGASASLPPAEAAPPGGALMLEMASETAAQKGERSQDFLEETGICTKENRQIKDRGKHHCKSKK